MPYHSATDCPRSKLNVSRAVTGLLIVACVAVALQQPSFSDITALLGITFKVENSPTSRKYLPETMGGGVAIFDLDNDGRLDIFFVNGARIDDPMAKGQSPDKSDRRHWDRLYRQNANGRFEDATESAGLTGVKQNLYGMGAATGDYDNDGFVDLYVTGVGRNILYRNNGDGTFADVTARAGVAGNGWSTSAGFFDYDNDGQLDLFVARYLTWSFDVDRFCGERRPGARSYCHPDNFSGAPNMLFRNNGDGTFEDVSGKAGIANPDGKGLGVAFADFNNDGWTDIYVANDSVQCFLYRNNRDGTFTDISLVAGAGFNEDGKTFAGMGTDFSDFNNDGRPDIIVTDLSNERYVLFKNNGDDTFVDVTNSSGLGRATLTYSGWSTRLFDYDNDGWKDLFVAQGHVMDNIEVTSPNLKYKQPALLLRNLRGTFSPVDGGKPFQNSWAGRGAAFGDLDNDGDLDVVVTNVGQNAYVLQNDGGNRQGWIELKFRGKRSNRDGIGAVVKVTSSDGLMQHYTVNTAVGYLSASAKNLVVGLADSKTAMIEIRWPSGTVQTFRDVPARTKLQAVEPDR